MKKKRASVVVGSARQAKGHEDDDGADIPEAHSPTRPLTMDSGHATTKTEEAETPSKEAVLPAVTPDVTAAMSVEHHAEPETPPVVVADHEHIAPESPVHEIAEDASMTGNETPSHSAATEETHVDPVAEETPSAYVMSSAAFNLSVLSPAELFEHDVSEIIQGFVASVTAAYNAQAKEMEKRNQLQRELDRLGVFSFAL